MGGVEVQLHSFLTSAVVGSDWSTSRPSRFAPGKEGGWVGPTCPDVLEKKNICSTYSLIALSVLRKVHSLFQSGVLHRVLSSGSSFFFYSILSFPQGHSIGAYVFFLVFPSLPTFLLFFFR
jgi:hypothetical protein